jgi:hypothetical protein
MSDVLPGGLSIKLLYRLIVLAHFSLCASFALAAPFAAGFDEHAHLSYIAHIAERGDLAPSFDDMYLVGLDDEPAWTVRRNYLNHPSPYYVALAWLTEALGASGPATVILLRLANAALSAAALALVLQIGLRADWTPSARVVFGVTLATVPTLPILGGLVNNDNLAWFGGALCCLGAFGVLKDGPSGKGLAQLVGGFVLASVAKLTAAMLAGGLLIGTLLAVGGREGWRSLADRRVLLGLAFASLALLPYIHLWAEYGSPAPYTGGQAAMLEERLAEIPEWRDQRYGLPRYVTHFFWSLVLFWPTLLPRTDFELMLLVAPLTCLWVAAAGFLATVGSVRRGSRDPVEILVLCGVIAMAAVLAVHLGFTFLRHLETGWLKGVYPRYYFPLLAVVPAACAIAVTRRNSWPVATLIVVLSLGFAGYAGLDVVDALF